MKKKTMIILAWAYGLWVAATLLNNKKTSKEISLEIENSQKEWKKPCEVMFKNFVLVHKNLFEKLKKEYYTEENKEKVTNLVEDYKEKVDWLYADYKEKAAEYGKQWGHKLEDYYKEKIDEIDEFKNQIPDYIEEAKTKLKEKYQELRNEIKK